MKTVTTFILAALFSLTVFADVPGNKPRPATDVNIILPANTANWKYYYSLEFSGKSPELLTAKENIVTIPGGRGMLQSLQIYGQHALTGLKTKTERIWGGKDELFIIVDSASADKLYYRELKAKDYNKLIKLRPVVPVKSDTGSFNTNDKPAIKYYKSDGPGPILLIVPAFFVLIIVALVGLIVFIVRMRKRNKGNN